MSDEYKADLIDVKIIDALRKDARTNIRLLAKECDISSTAVLSRIKKLKSLGIIIGTELWVGQNTFDFQFKASVEILAETQHIEKILEKIRADPNVIVCTKGIDRYNLLCLIIGRDIYELNRITQKINNFSGVKGTAINLWAQETIYRGVTEENINTHYKPDDLDGRILELLLKDCQVSCTEIGSKVKVSIETVRKRIKRMKAEHIIRACSITIDWYKLGYEGSAFFFIELKHDYEPDSILNNLKKIEGLWSCGKVIGAYDIFSVIRVKGIREVTKLVDLIQKLPGVAHVDVSIANFTYFSYAPIPRRPIHCDTLELS